MSVFKRQIHSYKVFLISQRFQQKSFISVKNCQFCELETVHTPKSKNPKQQSETKQIGEKLGQVQIT